MSQPQMSGSIRDTSQDETSLNTLFQDLRDTLTLKEFSMLAAWMDNIASSYPDWDMRSSESTLIKPPSILLWNAQRKAMIKLNSSIYGSSELIRKNKEIRLMT